ARRDGLRAIAPVAVAQLRRDLNYDPKLQRGTAAVGDWLERHFDNRGPFGRDHSVFFRLKAARALSLLGIEAKSAEPDLIAGLRDSEPYVQAYCALALGNIGDISPTCRPTLVALA